MHDSDMRESYYSCAAYSHMLISSKCRIPRGGKNNITKFCCLSPYAHKLLR